MSAQDAAKVVDVLAQTQDAGKITIDQYAQGIGRAASIAATAGVTFEEFSAAIATATAKGVPAESAISGTRQAIVNCSSQQQMPRHCWRNTASTMRPQPSRAKA
jgi:hypothetical protein